MWQDGELDFARIPSWIFVHVYAFIKWLTGGGTNILIGQPLFWHL
jgi:hypothetical protein